ncbi:MAG: Rrf2 family transcriptional regulator [Candidatus Gottesmanbacteria bacterium]|nr:Rrf2 family transcriptional regulator [Candidatus Gottesmanbacteria bacterium]
MHFHKNEHYGLLLMGELAGSHSSRPLSLASLSERHGVSLPFLKKIVRSLKSHGLVESKEGIGGGYTLARKADTISIWDIVSAFDSISGTPDPGGMFCPVNKSCLPQHIRIRLTKSIQERLESLTLREVSL